MDEVRDRTEWEILFPAAEEYTIDRKIIHVKELSWEEMTSITSKIGSLLREITKITQAGNVTGSTNINQLIGMGMFGMISNMMDRAPERLLEVVEIGTDIPKEIIPQLKAKVIPLCVLKIFEVNKELGEAFFDLGRKMGIKKKEDGEAGKKTEVTVDSSDSSARSSGQDLVKPGSGS
jgi:hypothetical protein